MSNRVGITDEQIIEAVNSEKSFRGAARKLGCSHQSVMKRYKKLAPGTTPDARVYDNLALDGLSEYVKTESGGYWAKYNKEKADLFQDMAAFVEGLTEKIKPVEPKPQITAKPSQIINQYTLTDYHLGMMAWGEEAGENWNLKKAEKTLIAWFQQAIELSPESDTAIFAQLGDFLHWDGLEAITPSHGHVLDADTRFQKLIRMAIKIVRQVISMLLDKHNHVHVIMATGNHDIASSAHMREWLHALYDDEPRVTIDRSPDVYYCYHFGKVSLFYHHGHKRNPSNISSVFAGKFRNVYGDTEYSYAHLGHKHSNQVAEDNLMIVEQHPTLAAADAYASHGGWLSKRNAKVITYHKDFGKVGELVLSPEMLRL
jgi:hypothetical protein